MSDNFIVGKRIAFVGNWNASRTERTLNFGTISEIVELNVNESEPGGYVSEPTCYITVIDAMARGHEERIYEDDVLGEAPTNREDEPAAQFFYDHSKLVESIGNPNFERETTPYETAVALAIAEREADELDLEVRWETSGTFSVPRANCDIVAVDYREGGNAPQTLAGGVRDLIILNPDEFYRNVQASSKDKEKSPEYRIMEAISKRNAIEQNNLKVIYNDVFLDRGRVYEVRRVAIPYHLAQELPANHERSYLPSGINDELLEIARNGTATTIGYHLEEPPKDRSYVELGLASPRSLIMNMNESGYFAPIHDPVLATTAVEQSSVDNENLATLHEQLANSETRNAAMQEALAEIKALTDEAIERNTNILGEPSRQFDALLKSVSQAADRGAELGRSSLPTVADGLWRFLAEHWNDKDLRELVSVSGKDLAQIAEGDSAKYSRAPDITAPTAPSPMNEIGGWSMTGMKIGQESLDRIASRAMREGPFPDVLERGEFEDLVGRILCRTAACHMDLDVGRNEDTDVPIDLKMLKSVAGRVAAALSASDDHVLDDLKNPALANDRFWIATRSVLRAAGAEVDGKTLSEIVYDEQPRDTEELLHELRTRGLSVVQISDRPGTITSGVITDVAPGHVIQNIGRGNFRLVPAAEFEGRVPLRGENVAIRNEPNGKLSVSRAFAVDIGIAAER